jgi:uncharacterized protein (DUF2147 family)
MKKFAIIAALALCSLPGAAVASDSGITGVWATGSEGGRVKIYRCGGNALCGKIVDATRLRANPDLRDVRNPDESLRNRKLMGLVVLRGFTGGPTEWEGGPLYDPESGDGAASGSLTLRKDGKLEVEGCVAAIFCRTKVWIRVR